MLGPAGLGSAQSPDAVPPQGTIEIQVRGIPSDDATSISGQYLVDGNGTIRMPQLPPGQDVLRVVGKTARQIEDMPVSYTHQMCIRDRPSHFHHGFHCF